MKKMVDAGVEGFVLDDNGKPILFSEYVAQAEAKTKAFDSVFEILEMEAERNGIDVDWVAALCWFPKNHECPSIRVNNREDEGLQDAILIITHFLRLMRAGKISKDKYDYHIKRIAHIVKQAAGV